MKGCAEPADVIFLANWKGFGLAGLVGPYKEPDDGAAGPVGRTRQQQQQGASHGSAGHNSSAKSKVGAGGTISPSSTGVFPKFSNIEALFVPLWWGGGGGDICCLFGQNGRDVV
jgi:hypothetical protein